MNVPFANLRIRENNMIIGVPKEIKNHEYRIGLTPAGVKELVVNGHEVIVENNGAASIGFDNDQYIAAGAKIIDSAAEIFASADMIIKVKEPQPNECKMLRPGQILFTYLHLAPDPQQTELLVASGATCIAYETVTAAAGGLPLLAPMSEVAGRMSIQAGAHALEKAQGGLGALLGGVPGVAPAKVLVIGGGVVGTQAARMAVGMGADVTILDRSLPRLRQLDTEFDGRLKTVYSTADAMDTLIVEADLVVGAVLIPGAAAPKLVTRKHISMMKQGAVVVDVAIDQGGCFETSKATTHQEPTYVVDGVVHYCVANMPGGVARTSTMALTNATMPFAVTIANKGAKQALLDDEHLLAGLNVAAGKITYKPVADDLGYEYVEASVALSA
jgi:alanine dehydrogenase